MRIYLLLTLVFVAGFGCKHLVTRENRKANAAELAEIKSLVRPPKSLGIKVIQSGNQTIVRWQEQVLPPHPVTHKLLPPDEFGSVQPIVQARLNGGRPVPLVIDTGAPVNLVHMSLAIENRVQIADPDQLGNVFRGFGGYEATYYGMIDSMRIGALQFRQAFTAIRTHTYERKFMGLVPVFRWEGNLIGMSSLCKLAYVTIDYPGKLVTFSSRDPFPEPERPPVACLPFRFEAMQILVDLALNETNVFSGILDTGNEASLMIPSKLVDELGYTSLAANGKPGRYLGLGGEIPTRTFTVPEIRLADAPFANVDAVSAPDTYPLSIGSGFLKQFRVTIDFKRKKVWIEQ